MAKMSLSEMAARAYLTSQMPLFSGDEQLEVTWHSTQPVRGEDRKTVDRCGDVRKLSEHRHLCPSLCREHVMSEVVLVVLPPMVISEKSFNVTPGIRDGISVVSGLTKEML